MARYVRVLDQYSNIPPSEKAIFPRLRIVRCAEGCDTPIPAPTLIKRVGDPRICPSLTFPDRVRSYFLRWHPYRSSDDYELQYEPVSLPTGRKKAVVFFPEIEWRTLHEDYLELSGEPFLHQNVAPCEVDRFAETNIIVSIVQQVFVRFLYDLLASGGLVIFVAFEDAAPESKWLALANLVLNDCVHQEILKRKYKYTGDRRGALDIPLNPEDEQLKDNIGIVTVTD